MDLQKERRRWPLITCAMMVAIGLTAYGISQTLIYKDVPPLKFFLWFPLAALVGGLVNDDLLMVIAALLQFPIIAVVMLTIWFKWRSIAGLICVILIYATIAVVLGWKWF